MACDISRARAAAQSASMTAPVSAPPAMSVELTQPEHGGRARLCIVCRVTSSAQRLVALTIQAENVMLVRLSTPRSGGGVAVASERSVILELPAVPPNTRLDVLGPQGETLLSTRIAPTTPGPQL